MPITITWNDGVAAATTFVMPDDVVAAVDRFRQTVTQFDAATQALVVIYPSVQAMIVGLFVQSIIMPALAKFPTTAIAAAQANCAAAESALAVAQTAAIPGFA